MGGGGSQQAHLVIGGGQGGGCGGGLPPSCPGARPPGKIFQIADAFFVIFSALFRQYQNSEKPALCLQTLLT
jgi:hypothetical protein